MTMTPMTLVMIGNLLLFRFFRLFTTLLDDFDVVVEYGCDHGDHIGLDYPSPDVLGAANSYVDDALESKVPFPHVHHIFASSLF